MTKPPSNTAIIIETKLDAAYAQNLIRMYVKFNGEVGDPEPCPVSVVCNFCNGTSGECPEVRPTYQANDTKVQDTNKYGADISYHCG